MHWLTLIDCCSLTLFISLSCFYLFILAHRYTMVKWNYDIGNTDNDWQSQRVVVPAEDRTVNSRQDRCSKETADALHWGISLSVCLSDFFWLYIAYVQTENDSRYDKLGIHSVQHDQPVLKSWNDAATSRL